DGTKVWLNAGSTISYNPMLSGKNRLVSLKGEAYFEVTKNPQRPFIVDTKKLQVKVLGTHFNVKAYPEDKTTETTLEEGSVELKLKEYPNQAPVKLKPGEHAVFESHKKDIKIEKTDTYLLTAWRDRKFVFKDATLKQIIEQLEKFYNVRIHLKDASMEQIRFRGMFSYDQNIFDALEAIEQTTKLKYKMNGRDIWLQ
ncbi:MAG TPA: FecR domain-containing protein, partial [Sunxiuqinia sp.]|nr:FecR domain-containing protein [Sunxiuqinia sp.]